MKQYKAHAAYEHPADRLLRYAAIPTASQDGVEASPSTKSQFVLANMLAEELSAMGAAEVWVSPECYVYAQIPACEGLEDVPAIGFLAHLDTSPDFCGEGVAPRLIPDYDGGEVELGCGRTLRPADFPQLAECRGRTLIVTDGSTLLGADDKAGIAEIMSMAEQLLHGDVPHGKVCIAFTPDEEIGGGADLLDLQRFGADFAYTVDGGVEGEVVYENFNAAAADVAFRGVNVHPGEAKGVMVNAALLAMEFNGLLPAGEVPAETEGYEGFFHLCSMTGTVEEAHLHYIVRDHDSGKFAARQQKMLEIAAEMNRRYGADAVTVSLRQQYRNMAECIRPAFHLVEAARKAAESCGVTPVASPIRGGTDGANLSFKGLPCPNLGTASFAAHGPYEYATAEGMEKVTEILLAIVKLYADGSVK